MNVQKIITEDINSLSLSAAKEFASIAQDAIDQRGEFLVALSGGSTPEKLFSILAKNEINCQIDWKRSKIFWGDERCVPPLQSGSNYLQAKTLLLDPLNIPEHNIHRVIGELGPQKASWDYSQKLMQIRYT